jgi:hypothetical protein
VKFNDLSNGQEFAFSEGGQTFYRTGRLTYRATVTEMAYRLNDGDTARPVICR